MDLPHVHNPIDPAALSDWTGINLGAADLGSVMRVGEERWIWWGQYREFEPGSNTATGYRIVRMVDFRIRSDLGRVYHARTHESRYLFGNSQSTQFESENFGMRLGYHDGYYYFMRRERYQDPQWGFSRWDHFVRRRVDLDTLEFGEEETLGWKLQDHTGARPGGVVVPWDGGGIAEWRAWVHDGDLVVLANLWYGSQDEEWNSNDGLDDPPPGSHLAPHVELVQARFDGESLDLRYANTIAVDSRWEVNNFGTRRIKPERYLGQMARNPGTSTYALLWSGQSAQIYGTDLVLLDVGESRASASVTEIYDLSFYYFYASIAWTTSTSLVLLTSFQDEWRDEITGQGGGWSWSGRAWGYNIPRGGLPMYTGGIPFANFNDEYTLYEVYLHQLGTPGHAVSAQYVAYDGLLWGVLAYRGSGAPRFVGTDGADFGVMHSKSADLMPSVAHYSSGAPDLLMFPIHDHGAFMTVGGDRGDWYGHTRAWLMPYSLPSYIEGQARSRDARFHEDPLR